MSAGQRFEWVSRVTALLFATISLQQRFGRINYQDERLVKCDMQRQFTSVNDFCLICNAIASLSAILILQCALNSKPTVSMLFGLNKDFQRRAIALLNAIMLLQFLRSTDSQRFGRASLLLFATIALQFL